MMSYEEQGQRKSSKLLYYENGSARGISSEWMYTYEK